MKTCSCMHPKYIDGVCHGCGCFSRDRVDAVKLYRKMRNLETDGDIAQESAFTVRMDIAHINARNDWTMADVAQWTEGSERSLKNQWEPGDTPDTL